MHHDMFPKKLLDLHVRYAVGCQATYNTQGVASPLFLFSKTVARTRGVRQKLPLVAGPGIFGFVLLCRTQKNSSVILPRLLFPFPPSPSPP